MERYRGAVVGVAVVAALVVTVSAGSSYTVVSGDTLSAIAARFGTTVGALTGANDISDPNRIRIGQTLAIPGSESDDSGFHVVRRGETLSSIAARYGLSVAVLAETNGISDPRRLLANTRLRVDGRSVPELATGGGGSTHVVAAGETLSGIAARHGVRLAELAQANDIADANRIRAGQELTIPGGWHCPVRGDVRFVNDFGYQKPGGRFHDGVDLYAPRGRAAVAPVGGVVEHLTGQVGGLQYRLQGDDGHLYIGTHLDAFGASGRVTAGTVIGYVGDTGNARGTPPHLHFEIHPKGGGPPINPYPALARACR